MLRRLTDVMSWIRMERDYLIYAVGAVLYLDVFNMGNSLSFC